MRWERAIVTGWHFIAKAFGNLQVAIAVRNRPVSLRVDIAAMLKQKNRHMNWSGNLACTRLPSLNIADIRLEDKCHLLLCQPHLLPCHFELFRCHDHLPISNELLDRQRRCFASLHHRVSRGFSSYRGNDIAAKYPGLKRLIIKLTRQLNRWHDSG